MLSELLLPDLLFQESLSPEYWCRERYSRIWPATYLIHGSIDGIVNHYVINTHTSCVFRPFAEGLLKMRCCFDSLSLSRSHAWSERDDEHLLAFLKLTTEQVLQRKSIADAEINHAMSGAIFHAPIIAFI